MSLFQEWFTRFDRVTPPSGGNAEAGYSGQWMRSASSTGPSAIRPLRSIG
ncbi:MAG TPA: hypothetical protein VGH93_00980 [Solirubrobacteraceae bacterium]|jgi:hypothetical protein